MENFNLFGSTQFLCYYRREKASLSTTVYTGFQHGRASRVNKGHHGRKVRYHRHTGSRVTVTSTSRSVNERPGKNNRNTIDSVRVFFGSPKDPN